MKFIETPNLPKNSVKISIVDCNAGEEIAELERLGISVIPSKPLPFLEHSICSHPDMQICHIQGSEFYVFECVYNYYKTMIETMCGNMLCENFNKVPYMANSLLTYPDDCILNSVVGKEWVIIRKGNSLFDNIGKNTIYVRQGYCKCSICTVCENAIITADKGIAEFAQNNGIDVCIVSNNSIQLQGYKNGFIGGTCGKISKNTLAFFGDIKKYPDSDKIISFCKNYGIDCISLSNNSLTDYGSLIPITESV
jgi:hypothetical protein